MDEVGLGFVGVGGFAAILAEATTATEGARVVSCFARSQEPRRAFADAHGATPAPTLQALLEVPAVHGVVVATPHSTHADIVEVAAAAGKHVFVEKPLTLTVADARRAIEATSAAGVTLQVGHNRRRQPANRRIRSMIEAGELGTVLQLEAFHSAPGAHRPGLPAWRTDPTECPAGGMTALGVHMVDTFNYLVGPATRVVAVSKRVAGTTPLDEATSVTIEYEGGPIAHIGTSYFVAPVVTVAAYGTDANVWNEEDGTRLFTQARADGARTERPIDVLDTIRDEVAEFVACVRGAATPETGGPEGLEVAAVLEAIQQSIASGRAVDVATRD